tara:strand:+ start:558 stop:881 length:324 start_codon:yes stop_codon:yes gene_type:complete
MQRKTHEASRIIGLIEQIHALPKSAQASLFHQLGYGTADYLGDDVLVNDQVAAAELDIAPVTLSIWRSTGRYHLPYVKVGRLVKYQMGDLRAFKRSRRVDTSDLQPS